MRVSWDLHGRLEGLGYFFFISSASFWILPGRPPNSGRPCPAWEKPWPPLPLGLLHCSLDRRRRRLRKGVRRRQCSAGRTVTFSGGEMPRLPFLSLPATSPVRGRRGARNQLEADGRRLIEGEQLQLQVVAIRLPEINRRRSPGLLVESEPADLEARPLPMQGRRGPRSRPCSEW